MATTAQAKPGYVCPRPCRHCGALQSAHTRKSACRSYEADQTPEYLLRVGVRSGEWFNVPIAHLEYVIREATELKLRVWAVLVLSAMGELYKKGLVRQTQELPGKGSNRSNRPLGRLAVTWDAKKGYQRPAGTMDIVRRLNAADEERGLRGRVDRNHVSEALAELQADRVLKLRGKPVKGGQLIFVYAKPLKSVSYIVPPAGNNPKSTSTKQNYLHGNLISTFIVRVKSTCVKSLHTQAREALKNVPEDVASAATAEVEATAARLTALIDELEQKLERLTQEPQPEAAPEADKPAESGLQLTPLRDVFPDEAISDKTLSGLQERLQSDLGPELWDPGEFVRFVAGKRSRRKFRFGLILKADGLVDEFIAVAKRRATQQREAEAVRAESGAAAQAIAEAMTFEQYCASLGREVPADPEEYEELMRFFTGDCSLHREQSE